MKDSRDYIAQEAAEQTAMKEEYQRQLKALPEGRLTVARKGTGAYYSKFQSGTKTYLGTAANEEVKSLQQRRILEASIQRIDSNLKLMDQYVRQYQPVDRMSVLQTLPKAYHCLLYTSWHIHRKGPGLSAGTLRRRCGDETYARSCGRVRRYLFQPYGQLRLGREA